MNDLTFYTPKELNTMARLQAKVAAKECGFNSATSIQWKLRIYGGVRHCVSLDIQYRCPQDPTGLFETSIVI